jgi:putative FmdB family regulatory protein
VAAAYDAAMPLYDFRCRSCAAEFEATAPFGGLAPCPECGAEDVERLLRPFAGPFTIRPRGYAARKSDGARAAREEQRAERKEARRQAREQDS